MCIRDRYGTLPRLAEIVLSLAEKRQTLNTMIVAVQDVNTVFGIHNDTPGLVQLAWCKSVASPSRNGFTVWRKALQTLISVLANHQR